MLGGSKAADTGSAVCLTEGERTLGVWLPLALIDVVTWLKVVVRMLGDKETRRHVVVGKKSEKLREWCLPMMAAAIEEDERRFEEGQRKSRRESLYDDLMQLAKTMGAEVKVGNG